MSKKIEDSRKNPLILAIEDSRDMQRVFQELISLLPENSLEMHWVYNARDGLIFLEQERPNIIILDLVIPLGSGWEVFQYIQSQARLRWIPLIIMSGRKQDITDKISEPFEYFQFCQKPFDGRELKRAIQRAIAQTRQRYQQDSQHSILANYLHTNVKPIHFKLQELLITKNWEEADAETTRLTFPVDRELLNKDSSSVRGAVLQAMDNFLLEDLQAIDYLWVIHSNGHFGLSVQWEIYQQMQDELAQILQQLDFYQKSMENVDDSKRYAIIEALPLHFTTRLPAPDSHVLLRDFLSQYPVAGIWKLSTALTIALGWLCKGSPEWVFDGEINYSLDAPKGHLPTVGRQELGVAFHHGFMLEWIFSKFYPFGGDKRPKTNTDKDLSAHL
jgi:DNA-binding response OmpR family regulator